MKKRFLFVIALLCVLTFTGCKKEDEKTTTLSTPQQITVQSDGDKSLIIFDEVKDADYYDIYINDVCVTVKAVGAGMVQFDASKIITLPQKYTIKVKAVSDKFFDSNFTDEYVYNHTRVLDTPIIHVDGTTLNWNKIGNADFYDVLVTTFNPRVETTHRISSNSFNFSNLLSNKGEYLFKVKAISDNNEYESSVYSNQIKYEYIQKLPTPNNLNLNYDKTSGEMLLTFVSGESVKSFTINIDGGNYNFDTVKLSGLWYHPNQLNNVYTIKLNSFAEYEGIEVNNATMLNVSVKANSDNQYLVSSEFSNSVSCQMLSVLSSPTINIVKLTNTSKLTITQTDSIYLSGFAIYLNELKYKTLPKDVREIELSNDIFGTKGVRVQAISNNNNCKSSNLSAPLYVSQGTSLGTLNVTFKDGKISWDSVNNATDYYVELSNKTFRYAEFVKSTILDVSGICPYGEYELKVIAMANSYNQTEKKINISYQNKLNTPNNAEIRRLGDNTYLYFDEIDGAEGYILYLNNIEIKNLFTSSPINLNPYINTADRYKVQVKAVELLSDATIDSDLTTEQYVESVKTLSSPVLSIVENDSKYYLHINVDESEATLASGYEVWINYQSVGNYTEFKDRNIDITSYFANAGRYNFMVKATANENNPYVKDSNVTSLTKDVKKQLDMITEINVTQIESESTYILTFKQQTMAAKYKVEILKESDEDYRVEFETSQAVADITQYIVENGVYKIYIQALALEDGFYTHSLKTGNPYRFSKGETLQPVQNIQITKCTDTENAGKVNLTWTSVNNSSGYQVYVYYNEFNKNVLKKSIFVAQSSNPSVNIGSGEYKCLNKEGVYSIQIKALGDGENYETSKVAIAPYTYIMESRYDFERNEIFINGNTVNYKVNTAEDLKNLLWYHYLYNRDVWGYSDTLQYNLKVYCSADLNKMAKEISENIEDLVLEKSTDIEKMNIISKTLLNQYAEIMDYTEGYQTATVKQAFCLSEDRNVYIFRYQDNLPSAKTETVNSNKQVYKEKISIVDEFDQRNSTYVFEIDKQQVIDVTTTEQLFMALQYNRKPNFVGECDVAKAVYENARFALRQICSDNMTEYEKTLAIYDFLTKSVILNDQSKLSNSKVLKDFYLEGLFYNENADNGLFDDIYQIAGKTLASQGLSKAFVVLCSIEGIDSIKADGLVGGEKYSFNKVYIDIDKEDNDNDKKWYIVDMAKAMQNSVAVKSDDGTTNYQAALYNYFLVTDARINDFDGKQATFLHKRMGGTDADYAANTEYNYYTTHKYSCVYNGEKVVDNATFAVSDETGIKNAIIYAMQKANKKYRVIVSLDAKQFMNGAYSGNPTSADLAALTNRIVANIYENANTVLGGQYRCSTTNVSYVDNRYIIIAVQGINFAQ